jgi:hypothetical protein
MKKYIFCEKYKSTIPTKKFRPPFCCHFTKIASSLTFIVIMIDVCKLKFEIYCCHVCFTAYVSGMTVVDEIFCPPLYGNKLLTRHCTVWIP